MFIFIPALFDDDTALLVEASGVTWFFSGIVVLGSGRLWIHSSNDATAELLSLDK